MIEFTHAEVVAGGVVSGRLVVRPGRSAPTGVSHAWLVWRIEARAMATVMAAGGRGGVIEDYVVIDRRPIDGSPGGNAFEFRVPEQGPVSYDGKLFRLVWEVVVGGVSPAPQPVACAAFRVLPGPLPAD